MKKEDNILKKLFEEEERINRAVRVISSGILDLSDYSVASGAIELAEVEVIGKRICEACSEISKEINFARKTLGSFMTSTRVLRFKGFKRHLHEIEDELSLVHGDIDAIGRIAEKFHSAKNRSAAFDNLKRHYSGLVEHASSLLIDTSAFSGNKHL